MPGIVKLAKMLLCSGLKYSGTAWVQEHAARWAGRQHLPILLFHRVSDLIPSDPLTVPPQRFRAICQLLARSFHVVPLAQVFIWQRERMPLPHRTVAITFDDCYQDNLHAAHILAEYGLPATFFIPTAFVGTDHVFSWDQHLPRMPNLSWYDLHTIQCLGHEIGSHTVNHPNMALLKEEEAWNELVESKATLEKHLERPCRLFAYPFGGRDHWNPAWNPLVQKAGYLGTVSATGGFVRPGTSPVLLPREPMPFFECMLNLELHLAGCLDWMYSLRRSLGLLPAEPLFREPPADVESTQSGRLALSPESADVR